MMKVFLENTGKLVALLFILFLTTVQLLTFCSRKIHPEQSVQGVQIRPSDRKIVQQPEKRRVEIQTEILIAENKNLNAEIPGIRRDLEHFLKAGVEKVIDPRETSAGEIITTAQKYLGVPYCMGGISIKCMDCSGLLVKVFALHDIRLPHNSQEQARYGKIITGKEDLVKGDLVFFTSTYKTNNLITHSGIYTGDTKFIHTSTGKGVIITSLNDLYWKEKFLFGTRVLK
jgi:cell wall-associated NlpC family hydrolase